MHLLGLDKSVHILQCTLWIVIGILELTIQGRIAQIINWYIQPISWTVIQVEIISFFHSRKECTLLVFVIFKIP